MFAALYWLFCGILYIIAAPFLALTALIKPKYKDSLPQRFFPKTRDLRDSKGSVWIHACSLGEVNSLAAIIPHIKGEIILSAITNTGQARARELFGACEHIRICYLPFETFVPFALPKTLKKLIVVESELWFMLFFIAKKRGAKTILLNARISAKSFPKYQKFTFFYRKIFERIDSVLAQSAQDRERLENLGARNCEVIGNIKALNVPRATRQFPKFNGTMILAASTHKGEEEAIIRAYSEVFGDSKSHRLIIAPRHPERFGEVWGILARWNLKSARFSEVGVDYSAEILLIDALGELINLYNIADVVILGGSFVEVGGHNPLECAAFGTKLISGKHIFHQHALFALISGYTLIDIDELPHILRNLDTLPHSAISGTESLLEAVLTRIGA